jgi:hypothetical protein
MQLNEQTTLSPSWLDFQVYRLVKVEQYSMRGAAQSLGIDEVRVCRTLARVGQFLLATAPAANDEAQRQKQLDVSLQIAAERIEYLHGLAVLGYRQSQKTTFKLRKGAGDEGKPQFDRETSSGDSRFLTAAARLALMASKLPAPGMEILSLQGYPLDDNESAEDVAGAENPPPGDCSPQSPQKPVSSAKQPERTAVNPVFEGTSIAGVSADLLAHLRPTGTVQQEPARGPKGMAKERRREDFLRGAMNGKAEPGGESPHKR